ncbi:MAG: DUF2961 domain-containing protein [Anaerolineae bacterium]|nr:DUF2961 domain-containing protein [Anaerolineae bacterium]
MAVFKGSPLGELARIRNVRTRRVSSWDRTGGNDDRLHIAPGQTVTLADIQGAGCINHIWCTIDCQQEHYLRRIVLRMRWDNEPGYSVEVPIGDFFGVGHALTTNYVSLPLQMSPADGKAFNCFFPMPFAERALIEVENECDVEVLFYYYIDYEIHPAIDSDLGRFHAQWRRQNPCDGIPDADMTNPEWSFGGVNLDGRGNYVILEAQGQGHYVGCNLSIHNLRRGEGMDWPEGVPWPLRMEDFRVHGDKILKCFNWYGEGDDMIFIDGEVWPPSLHGTGTEDYFNTAWCPAVEYSAPYHGITLAGDENWSGKISLYRFHIEDPICFQQSIRVTIEHGHANRRSDDYASTAYWYQHEPHLPFPPLLPVARRLPRPD